MPERMGLQQDLSAIWNHIVSTGQIRTEFLGPNRKRIESGLRMCADGPQHYAVDLDSGEEIAAGIRERVLSGSNFVLQLNEFRALKPKPVVLGLGRQPDSATGVTECFFACQDPTTAISLLRRDIQIQTRLHNYQWAALYNALPVERMGHFLWVPIRSYGATTTFPHWLQVLTFPFLQDFLQLASGSSHCLTFFNSMHAGGSVNHIHFHSVYRGDALPLDEAPTISVRNHLVLNDYPGAALVYATDTPVELIWPDVSRLQERGIPLNLIHTGKRICLFARNIEHEVVQEFPSAILAGMELSGRPITTDPSFYHSVDWATIRTAIRKTTLSQEQLLSIVLQ